MRLARLAASSYVLVPLLALLCACSDDAAAGPVAGTPQPSGAGAAGVGAAAAAGAGGLPAAGTGGAPASTGGAPAAGTGGAAGAGAGGADAPGAAGAAPPDMPERTIDVAIYLLDGEPESTLRVLSNFGRDACQVERQSGCDFERCPSASGLMQPNVGPLEARGDVGALTVTPPSVDGGLYESVSGAVWASGPIRFLAPGDTLPALDVTLPAPPVLSAEPALPSQASRSQPLAIEYAATGDETILVALLGGTDGEQVQLRCRVDASAGRAEIPVAMLERFPAGDWTLALVPETRRVFPIGTTGEQRVIVRREIRTSPIALQ
jgi:hypothetical protein